MTETQLGFSTFYAERSADFSKRIAEVIPGGVDSPFRSFNEVGGHTLFFNRALGSKLYDLDGNVYIDYLGAWGPAILGHCHPALVHACSQTLLSGPIFGAPHELELELATLLIEAVPSLEMVRFVNSGTEAVMSAVRLARGASSRNLVVMFEGCYHGHSDAVLASRTHSSSSGIPKETSNNTILVPYNDAESLEACLRQYSGQVAACLIEPVAGSMGVIPPDPGYLPAVSQICRQNDVLLIFDEVLTGLRVARGGAQALYGIKPDLTCFGKALGGGMAIGAYGGSKELMSRLQPLGDVYQAGTFSGNPLTMAGGVATLKTLSDKRIYDWLEERTAQLFAGLQAEINKKNLPLQLARVGSMFALVFSEKPVRNFIDSQKIDSKRFAHFYHLLLERGIYFPPSAVDAAALSAAHSEADVEETVRACAEAFAFI
ncbi:MAG: glutamate-1-semialdehyde 2,1-aminomutase [Candidatus Obscuribacterales bacterium]|nr:glutamate-1-semialdehyde 2,1-aminomutase [Candidatus Obscuribacterales bacterium]